MRLTFGILSEFSDRLNLEILNSRCKRDFRVSSEFAEKLDIEILRARHSIERFTD